MTADPGRVRQLKAGPPLQECVPLPQHPKHSKRCSSLLGLKKMSRDKTPGNVKYKRSDTGSLGSVSVLSSTPSSRACLLASSPDSQQTDDAAEAGAQKQKGSVQQRRNLAHVPGENAEDSNRGSLTATVDVSEERKSLSLGGDMGLIIWEQKYHVMIRHSVKAQRRSPQT